MKKKLIALLVSVVISAISPIACYASDATAESETAQPITVFDTDSKKLDFRGYDTATDYQGASAIIFMFEYTNKTSEAKSPLTDFFPTAFQNGVSLSSTTIADVNLSPYFTNAINQAKDGGTITYCLAYALTDTTDVELQISDSVVGGNVQTMTLPLSNASSDIPSGEDWEAKYNELLEQYNELQTKYDELEAKYNELAEQ